MKMSEYRLPKLVENSTEFAAINDFIAENTIKLWKNSKESVIFVPFCEKFIRALQMEHRKGRIIRGFELIERNLASESKGLQLVDEKTGTSRGQRVSRLLIISNDGAERYYRKVEGLIANNKPRVLPLMIDADSDHLGELFFGEGKTVKLMLLEHKESVSAALLAIIEAFKNKTEEND
jgi:hypothetical protein